MKTKKRSEEYLESLEISRGKLEKMLTNLGYQNFTREDRMNLIYQGFDEMKSYFEKAPTSSIKDLNSFKGKYLRNLKLNHKKPKYQEIGTKIFLAELINLRKMDKIYEK